MKTYLSAGAALAGYLVLAWISAGLLDLERGQFYLLFAILAFLGITGMAAFFWFWRKASGAAGATGAAAESTTQDDEIDALIHAAESRLGSSNLAQGAKLNSLPVIFVIGQPGSTKTSTILHSGLEPELLAGQVYQESNVTPTRLANIWFARGMVLVEAGGNLISEPARWARLLHHLQPGRLRSVVGKGQAPRAALLCCDAETFTRPGTADALAATARDLHARLAEISQRFGISFPVYAVFTRMNRIAFFEDFVRNLSGEEVSQALGATLPLSVQNTSGVYADEQARRLGDSFDGILYSLASHRLTLLPRENDPQKLPAAYEFPREFRKLRNGVVQFLVDVCRPSQLSASPFLRGFYFSGVRPVVVRDAAVAAEAPRPAQRASFDATGVFKAGGFAPASQPQAQAAMPGRRMPQWLFLGRLFSDVILRDEAAFGTSGSSVKTSMARRILLGAAAFLFLVCIMGFTISFFGNRSLENEVLDAARAIPAGEASGMNLPTPEALQRLDNLRSALAKLTAYEQGGAPLSMRWFLYSGDDLYPEARKLYYARFNQLLLSQTQASMVASLQRLATPPAPTDTYGGTYDALKAYLITTAEWKHSSNWLAPVLATHWSAGRPVDNLLPLARKQFDFYGEDLVRGNPLSEKNDSAAIDRARVHLSGFSGVEQIYQFMLADASRQAKKINFNEQFPGSAEVVVNNRDVPGAFTKAGWTVMQGNLKNADKFFGGERWVLGDYASAKPDAAKLGDELSIRYTNDYIARWREFLRITSVARYGGLKDAAKKLNTLSNAQTPLLALFWVATQNTSVDSPKVAEAFDAVQKVVPPPATTVQYVLPPNQEYMGSLAGLQASVNQAAEAEGPPDPGRASNIRMAADSARITVKKMGYTFKIDPEAHIETVALKLLEAPIDAVDALTKNMGAGEINGKARQFCTAFAGISSKFPFNPTASAEASLAEVDAMFRPRDGKLWAFYAESLQALLQKQGSNYAPNPAGGIALNPAFVTFFNNAARFSDALYPGGSAQPMLRYSLQAQRSDQINEMSLTVNGQTAKSSGSAPARQYIWPGGGTQNLRLSAKVSGGSDFEFQNRDGMWAVFRFFADADRWSPSGNGYLLEWVVRQGREGRPVMAGGKELTYRFVVDTAGAAPVFQKDYLNSLKCVSQAAR